MASYSVEYAVSGRAKCKTPKCKEKIAQGDLRFATTVERDERMQTSFTHWGCVWPSTLKNAISNADSDPSKLHGFDQLEPKDQEIVTVAFKEKKVVKRVKEAEGEASNSASASKEGAGSKKRKSTSKKPRDSKLQSDDDDLEEETSKKVKKGK